MIRTKRGIADTQFHWLFVILAGGFIFFFFALFINQAIVANQNKQTVLLLQYFDGVLSSSQNVQNLNDVIESTPSVTIEQKCELGGSSRLIFVEQDLDKPTSYLPIFSQHQISGAAYALKTLPHDAPFRVDNPLYLTDLSTLYIVLTDDVLVEEKYEKLLPMHANVVFVSDLSDVTESGFRDVVLITENTGSLGGTLVELGLSQQLINSNLRWVDVQIDVEKVYYYYKEEEVEGVLMLASEDFSDDSVSYTDDATLLGAIMSQDPDLFLCNKEKLDARTRIVALQIYARAGQFLDLASSILDSRCASSYATVRNIISTSIDNLADINVQETIETENERLIFFSCPSLY